MSRARMNIDQFLTYASVAITNADQTPEIAAALADFGYDDARMQAGADLLAQARQLHLAQQREYGEQYAATAALTEAHAAADALFTTHRKLAKLALKHNPQAQTELALAGRKKLSLSGWLGQAGQFYSNALASPVAQAALARYNITPEKLQQGQTLVQAVATHNHAQEREKSEAQQATQQRDAALDALDEWLMEFKTVAEIALAGQPQRLEALGFGAV